MHGRNNKLLKGVKMTTSNGPSIPDREQQQTAAHLCSPAARFD
jgi:hypothetical protein